MNSKLQFALTAESKEKLDALFTELSDLQRVIEKYPETQLMLLKPIFERFLHLLSNLGKDLVFVEGSAHIEATPLCDQDDVSIQAYSRMIKEPQGVFILTRGWDKAADKKFQRDLGRLLTSYCRLHDLETR